MPATVVKHFQYVNLSITKTILKCLYVVIPGKEGNLSDLIETKFSPIFIPLCLSAEQNQRAPTQSTNYDVTDVILW